MFGKDKAVRKLLENLTGIYQEIAKEKGLALGDFPDPNMMREKFASCDFSKFNKLNPKKMEALESMLTDEIPKLLSQISTESNEADPAQLGAVGGAQEASPFQVMKVGGATEATIYQSQWLNPPNPEEHRADFEALGPNEKKKLTGQKAKTKMIESKLPSNVLHKVWTLADVDKDGMLTLYEFALAMHFINMKLAGQDLPSSTPPHMASPPATEDS